MLTAELLRLRQAMLPLKVYTTESRRTIDLTDSRQAKRFAHIQDVESALEAAADLYDRLQPPLPPLVLHVRSLPAFQLNLVRQDYPVAACQDLAAISAHHLPRNPSLDELS